MFYKDSVAFIAPTEINCDDDMEITLRTKRPVSDKASMTGSESLSSRWLTGVSSEDVNGLKVSLHSRKAEQKKKKKKRRWFKHCNFPVAHHGREQGSFCI